MLGRFERETGSKNMLCSMFLHYTYMKKHHLICQAVQPTYSRLMHLIMAVNHFSSSKSILQECNVICKISVSADSPTPCAKAFNFSSTTINLFKIDATNTSRMQHHLLNFSICRLTNSLCSSTAMILNKLAGRHLKRLPTCIARDTKSEVSRNGSMGTFAGNASNAHLKCR